MDKSENNLNNLQSIISRMASNSSNCKTWTITISAALLAFFFNENSKILSFDKYYILLILILFWFLDIYYLALEKHFRNIYNEQVEQINNENGDKLIVIKGPKDFCETVILLLKAFISFSVWGFYLLTFLVLALILHLAL